MGLHEEVHCRSSLLSSSAREPKKFAPLKDEVSPQWAQLHHPAVVNYRPGSEKLQLRTYTGVGFFEDSQSGIVQ